MLRHCKCGKSQTLQMVLLSQFYPSIIPLSVTLSIFLRSEQCQTFLIENFMFWSIKLELCMIIYYVNKIIKIQLFFFFWLLFVCFWLLFLCLFGGCWFLGGFFWGMGGWAAHIQGRWLACFLMWPELERLLFLGGY